MSRPMTWLVADDDSTGGRMSRTDALERKMKESLRVSKELQEEARAKLREADENLAAADRSSDQALRFAIAALVIAVVTQVLVLFG